MLTKAAAVGVGERDNLLGEGLLSYRNTVVRYQPVNTASGMRCMTINSSTSGSEHGEQNTMCVILRRDSD